jgi:hypothetical protein
VRLTGTHDKVSFYTSEILEILVEEFDQLKVYDIGYAYGRVAFEVVSFPATLPAPHAAILTKLQVLTGIQQKIGVISRLGMIQGATKAGWTRVIARLSDVVTDLATTKMCFVAGTLVSTATGMVPIEQIRPGDMVWSKSDSGVSPVELRPVVQTFVTHPQALWELEYDSNMDGNADDTITGTAEHPIWIEEKNRFVPMDSVQTGMTLYLVNGQGAKVLRVQKSINPISLKFTTCNFEVEINNTYFVGHSGVWVHNTGAPCEKIRSVFFRKAKERGGLANLRKDRFNVLEETKSVFSNSDNVAASNWVQSLREVQSKMALDLAGGRIGVADMPSVSQMRAFVRRDPGRGSAGYHVHHTVERWIQERLGRSAGFDDVPGWMLDGAEHTFGPGRPMAGTVYGDLRAAIEQIPFGNNLEITTAIKQVYTGRGLNELWIVTEAWLRSNGFPVP